MGASCCDSQEGRSPWGSLPWEEGEGEEGAEPALEGFLSGAGHGHLFLMFVALAHWHVWVAIGHLLGDLWEGRRPT